MDAADKVRDQDAWPNPPPEAKKLRRPPLPAAVTVLLLISLPLMVAVFLFGDRAASFAADSLLWLQARQQISSTQQHDRLLGGLLSPDFDDPAACLSRYEASRRWRNSAPLLPVSPYLLQRLRRYEANHRRCGPGTAPYRDAVAQLESGRNGGRGECRYVVWFPIQGLGNRMLSLVSTFLFALLTGRVVLVHEPPEMEGLFCEPFPGTSWLLPPRFPVKDSFWSGASENFVTMLKNNVVRYDDDGHADGGNATSALPPYAYVHLENMNLRLQNHTFCEEDHGVIDRFNWIVLRSDSYFAVPLFLMPMYRAELDRMFPAKGAVFHHLGRYLLHPGNQAWEIVERFYDGYLAGAGDLLGVQVRIVSHTPVPFDIMYEQILRCTREHGLLPQVASSSAPRRPRPARGGAAKVKAVLVVSLKPEYYEKLHGVYYTNATVTGEVVAVYQPSHDQDQHTEARAYNERALAEIYLLSYCDTVVTTGWSTFGYVAHALAGLRPWLLTPWDWRKDRADVACQRAASVEPCLHSTPSLVCRAGQDPDPVAHTPFLRHCEDVPVGFKLFDE